MYAIIAIPFLFAAGYYHCSHLIKNSGSFLKDENGKAVEIDGVKLKVLDEAEEAKVGKLLGIMLLCYYPAYPIILIHRALKGITR